jgi:hypothetical protein
MKIENEFIPYTEALELKAIGFDEPCFAYFKDEEFQYPNPYEPFKNSEMKSWCITAPLYSQAFRWFRDEHKLWAYQIPWSGNMYAMTIYRLLEDSETVKTIHDRVIMNTWEEAELECLKKLIEIVKEK